MILSMVDERMVQYSMTSHSLWLHIFVLSITVKVVILIEIHLVTTCNVTLYLRLKMLFFSRRMSWYSPSCCYQSFKTKVTQNPVLAKLSFGGYLEFF